MVDYTTAQAGDTDDAANIGALSGHSNLSDYVANGLNFTNVDFTNKIFDLTGGEAFWLLDSMMADRAGEERYNVLITSHYDPRTSVSFTGGEVNHIYARPNLGVDDAPKIDVIQNESNAADEAFKIGTVDDTQDIAVEVNRNPDGIYNELEADDVVIKETLTAYGVVGTDELEDYAVTTAKLAQNAVTNEKVSDEAVGSNELQNDAVIKSKVANDAITAAALAVNSVTNSAVSAGAIDREAIKDGAVGSDEIDEGGVQNSELGKGSVDTTNLRADSVNPQQVEDKARYDIDGLNTSDSITNTASSSINGTAGASRGEIGRAGGPTSDSLWKVQGGGGRAVWSWNAEYRGGDWKYIVSNEPAMAIRMHAGSIGFWTADGGDSGNVINWETTYANNGGVTNAHNLGGRGPEHYLRSDVRDQVNGTLQFNNPIVFKNHDSIGANTAHDVIWENQPSGHRIHAHYNRPHWHLFHEPYNSMLKVHRDGTLEPQNGIDVDGRIDRTESITLQGGTGEPAPPYVGARLYYYNNTLYAVNDSGNRYRIQSF